MLSEFKKFILRGDVVALATGVIVAGAFGKVVTALTDGLVKPILQLIGGDPEITLGFTIDEVKFDLGLILSALIAFVITAAVIFFFIVKPAQALTRRLKTEEQKAPPAAPADVLLLREIRDLLQQQQERRP